MPAEQLWLSVEAPPQAAPRRERARRTLPDDAMLDRQIELVLSAPEPAVARPIVEVLAYTAAGSAVKDSTDPEVGAKERQPFSLWLLGQANRRGSLSDLAKAAKLDRLFPRAGSADDVRARFSLAGADGDAFEALEDAEREYERSCGVPA